jgi:hypothetical protein
LSLRRNLGQFLLLVGKVVLGRQLFLLLGKSFRGRKRAEGGIGSTWGVLLVHFTHFLLISLYDIFKPSKDLVPSLFGGINFFLLDLWGYLARLLRSHGNVLSLERVRLRFGFLVFHLLV